jgi:hypothetical protein
MQTENLKIARFGKVEAERQTQRKFKTNIKKQGPFFLDPNLHTDFSLDQHQPMRSFKSFIFIIIPTSNPIGAIFNIFIQSQFRFPECTRWQIKNSDYKPNKRDREVRNYKPKTLSGVHLLCRR